MLATRKPEAQPIILLAQAKLNAGFELTEDRRFVTAEHFGNPRVRHAPKDARAKVLQPGNHLPVARRIQCDDGPNSPGRPAQKKPAEVLHGFEVHACYRFEIIYE